MELRPPPEGMVDLAGLEGVILDVGYARPDNFTGAPLPGYGAPGAWLVTAAAAALEAALRDLAREGLGLVVYDAYRPRRATVAMVTHCESTGQEHLLAGWVGRRSRHNRGAAIDVGLVARRSGVRLPMGTPWDAFVEASGHDRAVGAARVHRRRLRAAMERAGFRPYLREWWHYELPLDPAPPERDVPYGAGEPEGDSAE